MPTQVLIADDSASHRRIIATALQQIPEIEITQAVNGREAVEKAKEKAPNLVLLDLSMPELNGAETTVLLKRLMPSVPVILFTLYGEDIGPTLASAVGADLVLSKSAGPDPLVAAVRADARLRARMIPPMRFRAERFDISI